ncbi:AAA family ATPase [Bradyrhizobium sp. 157]|uniref:AAA family ATPase n=1 Tax=Bradyrhizobium sp. 157 TaxID=2782631 RepID=UPI001FFA0AE3|nr:AAA family ATPase [Bradyrhizobium sp. 157]MCK1641218.1 AAA family ATPase [Bradyrhizobium sp. 157]
MASQHGWTGWQPQPAASALPSSSLASGAAATPSGFGGIAQSLAAGLGASFGNIGHRQWLYGTYLIRGQVTFCAAPGGLGKTSFSAALAIELAANKSVLGNKIWANKPKILYLNGEDDKEEMARRMWAFCLLHQISEQDIQRLSLLGSDDWRTKELAFMRNERGSSMVNEGAFLRFEQLLAAAEPDVVILDPLISFCGEKLPTNRPVRRGRCPNCTLSDRKPLD